MEAFRRCSERRRVIGRDWGSPERSLGGGQKEGIFQVRGPECHHPRISKGTGKKLQGKNVRLDLSQTTGGEGREREKLQACSPGGCRGEGLGETRVLVRVI